MPAQKHPDPDGKMVSYAPGYGPGADGEPVELPPDVGEVTEPKPEPEPEPDEGEDDGDEEETEASHPHATRKKKRR